MKEAFEKIIDRLEEEHKWSSTHGKDVKFREGRLSGLRTGMRIVKEVAEECKSLPVEQKSLTEKFNDSWIPCSSGELPQNEGMYLTTVYDKATGRCLLKHRKFENGKFVEGGQSRAFPVIAWQQKPLPAPYKPKGEK